MNTSSTSYQRYSIFGVCIQTDFQFRNNMCIHDHYPKIDFVCTSEILFPDSLTDAKLIYESPFKKADGRKVVYIYSSNNIYIMHFTDVAYFFLFPSKIICQILNDTPLEIIENHFLSTVFSFILEMQSKPTLHASAVVRNNYTIAFMGNSGDGKSTLSSAFISDGWDLLTDDILAVYFNNGSITGQPGYPTIRMWPDEAKFFLGSDVSLNLVTQRLTKRIVPVGKNGFGSFCSHPTPLTSIYIPERRNLNEWRSGIQIVPVPKHEAVIELIRLSCSPQLADAIGDRADRFLTLTSIAEEVPIRRLIYPSGLAYLPRVQEAVYEDMANLTDFQVTIS